MNINENKEIEDAEPSYILRDVTQTEHTQTYTETLMEFEYDEEISIFYSKVATDDIDGNKKEKESFWLGYIGAERLYYLAYPKTLSQAFEIVDNDYAWFRSQLTDVYKSESLEKK